MTELQPKQLQPVQPDQLDTSVVRKRQQDFEEIPPAKKCKEEYSDFFVFDGEENKEKEEDERATDTADKKVEKYFAQPELCRDSNLLDWWKLNASLFPHIAPVARHFLSLPATSVPSEWLFSDCGCIVSKKRAALLPTNVYMLAFLRANL